MANLSALTCAPLGLSLARSGSVYVVWYVAYIFSKAQDAGEGWLARQWQRVLQRQVSFLRRHGERDFWGLGAQTSRFWVEIGRMKKTAYSIWNPPPSAFSVFLHATTGFFPNWTIDPPFPTQQQLSLSFGGIAGGGAWKNFPPWPSFESLASALVTGWPAYPPADHPSSKLEGEGEKKFYTFLSFPFFLFLPPAKPSGHRTVRVVVADGGGGTSLRYARLRDQDFPFVPATYCRLQKLVSIQNFRRSGDEILQTHWPAQQYHNLAFWLRWAPAHLSLIMSFIIPIIPKFYLGWDPLPIKISLWGGIHGFIAIFTPFTLTSDILKTFSNFTAAGLWTKSVLVFTCKR